MKSMRLAGMMLAVGLVLTACGQNTSSAGATADAEVSSSQEATADTEQQASDEDAAATADGSVSVDVSEDGDEELLPLEIVETGVYASPSAASPDTVYVQYCGKITNPNMDVAMEFPKLQVTLENDDGTILATDTHTGMYIMPGDTVILGNQMAVPSAELSSDTNIEYVVSASDAVSPDTLVVPSSADYEITNVSEQHTDWNTTVTGKITNNYSSSSSMVRLSALFKAEGEIVGMANSFIDDLPAGGTMAFEISTYDDLPEHDTVEVYAQYWGY